MGGGNTFLRGCLRTWPHTPRCRVVGFEGPESGLLLRGILPSWEEGAKLGEWLQVVLFGAS